MAPGVFRFGAATNQEGLRFPKLPQDQAYDCRSYDDGESATVQDVGFLDLSGHGARIGFLLSPKERHIKSILERTRPTYYRRPMHEAERVHDLLYYDGEVVGRIGEYFDAAQQFKYISRCWERSTSDDDNKDDINIFLRPKLSRIHRKRQELEKNIADNAINRELLDSFAQRLRVQGITQRRMNVYDTGRYIASRRGEI